MATLETQYNNFKKQNPDSKLTFEDWKNTILSETIKIINSTKDDGDDMWEEVTLNNGLVD
jgi:hypothetical protein